MQVGNFHTTELDICAVVVRHVTLNKRIQRVRVDISTRAGDIFKRLLAVEL